MYRTVVPSPLGQLTLASDGIAITGLWIQGQKYDGTALTADAPERADLLVFQKTVCWLDRYFSGAIPPSLPPLAPAGTPFRQSVWQMLVKIPRGETTTYGALAQKLREQGLSASAQAVGGAVGHNPISILIPCHRVVGQNGSLTGYAGGLEAKRFLLELEGADGAVPYLPRKDMAL